MKTNFANPSGQRSFSEGLIGALDWVSPVATFPLEEASDVPTTPAAIEHGVTRTDAPLSISEARRLLAEAFGVDPSNVEIAIRV